MKRSSLVLSLLLLLPASSYAQVSVRGFADAGFTVFTATRSFNAVLGKASGPMFGGGVEIGKNQYFLSVDARRFRRTGHRVFVFQDQVFTLNVKDTVTVTPLDFTFGYRFRPRGIVPYLGGGIGWYRYQEVSEEATAAEDVKQTSVGYHVLAGAEMPLRRWLAAAIDGRWAAVPNALGDSATSVAKVYNEHDLGGFTICTRIIIGR